MGLTIDNSLGYLPKDSFFALLIDVINSPDPVKYMDNANFEYQKFELKIYTIDELGREDESIKIWQDFESFRPAPEPQ